MRRSLERPKLALRVTLNQRVSEPPRPRIIISSGVLKRTFVPEPFPRWLTEIRIKNTIINQWAHIIPHIRFAPRITRVSRDSGEQTRSVGGVTSVPSGV